VIPSKRTGQVSTRPSKGELYKKLTEASLLIKDGKWFPANAVKLQANWDELETTFGVETTLLEDRTDILTQALREIEVEDYAGARPPQQSYEASAHGGEMFAFQWESGFLQKSEMYFKFCLTGADNGRRVCVFSIHPKRDRK
jgi:hypothetical protein